MASSSCDLRPSLSAVGGAAADVGEDDKASLLALLAARDTKRGEADAPRDDENASLPAICDASRTRNNNGQIILLTNNAARKMARLNLLKLRRATIDLLDRMTCH